MAHIYNTGAWAVIARDLECRARIDSDCHTPILSIAPDRRGANRPSIRGPNCIFSAPRVIEMAFRSDLDLARRKGMIS